MRSVVFTDIPLSLHNAETEVLYLNAIDERVSPDLIVWYFASGAGVSFSTNACRGGSVLDGMRCDTCLIADQVPDGERTMLAVSLGTFRDPSSPMTIQKQDTHVTFLQPQGVPDINDRVFRQGFHHLLIFMAYKIRKDSSRSKEPG